MNNLFINNIRILLFVLSILFISQGLVHAGLNRELHTLSHYNFPTPLGLESKVKFWKKIYSEYSTDHYIVHDNKDLNIVYEVVYIKNSSKLSNRVKDRKLTKVKKKYKNLLNKLARSKNPLTLSNDAKRVFHLVGKNFKKASRQIRVQVGQKNRFRKGLEKSGMFNSKINRIIKNANLPIELGVIPHVESSFQINAYSSAGAAGIWQFTRGTGRIFMNVGYDVDERRDPILSTIAASKLLKSNFKALNSWPLAITAYNHGTQGMKNAKKRHGDSIVDIIKNYRSRTFGFASRNFYAEFLAALDVVQNKNKYFPALKFNKPQNLYPIVFNDYVHINSAMEHLRMTRNEIRKYNPALRKPVIEGRKRIPRGYVFNVPPGNKSINRSFSKIIPVNERHKNQIRSRLYTVSRGDTLSDVAKRFKISVNNLYKHNNLSHKNKIYIGQVLRLPGKNRPALRRVRLAKNNKLNENYAYVIKKYKVRRNDNLTKIAKKFNTNVTQVLNYNNIKNPNLLSRGQYLKIPHKILLGNNLNKKKVLKVHAAQIIPNLITAKIEKPKVISKGSRNPLKNNSNKNRPAFLPVLFKTKQSNQSGVGMITVDFDETLSHYAEWSRLPLKKILKLNRLKTKSQLNVHSKVNISFENIDVDLFAERRQEYHKGIQEDFFNNYQINKLLIRNILKGETVWEICNDVYSIPFWLLASYNPDKDVSLLSVGDPIVVPIVSSIISG
jgi:membrane-bound lytic murein transglycosylase D